MIAFPKLLRRLVALAPLLCACGAPSTNSTAGPAAPAAARSHEVRIEPALEPELERKLEALAEAVEQDRVALHIPGLALAIVQDDRLIFARGFGQADVESERAVTPATLFAIGSTTKAFTATLIGMLADEGKLAYDDPITKPLPWFTLPIEGKDKGPVLVSDLLAHRTGFARMDILWFGGRASVDEVLHTALHAEPMAPFRAQFHYNNIMFLAAGTACAAVAGEPWEELVRERIFVPLGMDSTNTSVKAAQEAPDLALGYQWDEDEQRFERRPMRDLTAIAPAGAINSNVLDLSHWLRFLLGRGEFEGRRLVAEERLAECWKPHNDVGPGVHYGFAWFLRQWKGEPVIEHGGNIDGFAAEIALLPGKKTGVALLANVGATPLQATIGPKVFEALYGTRAAESGPAREAPADDLARYTGVYIASFFQFKEAEFEVLERNGKLAVDVPGQMVYELAPPGPDGKRPFAAVPDQIQIRFIEEDGEVVGLNLFQGGFTFEIPRQGHEPAAEIALAELEPYLGSYADPLTGKSFDVVVQHNRLALDYPEQMVYELFPPDAEGRWLFRSSDQFAVEFHRDGDDVVESLTFHERGMERECERTGAGSLGLPSLEDVLALRKAAAFEARLSELGLCRLRGTLRFVHCGIQGTSTTLFDASERYREDMDLSPYLDTCSVFDGEQAWSLSSFEPLHELHGASRDQNLAGSPAVLFGDWSRRFDRARVLRVTEDKGKRHILVELRKGEAPPMILHVDAESGDIDRAEVQEVVAGLGLHAKTVTFEDWRDVEGLRLALRVITEDDSAGRVVLEYQGLDTHLPDAHPFAAPK